MRILHVNKFLYRRGGAESYMLDLADLQRDAGHEVSFFSMDHPDNLPDPNERWFAPRMELNPPAETLSGRLKAAGGVLYRPSARHGIDHVVRETRPDVVHLNNIYHQLSPSILRPLADLGIPTVMTLHDYKLVCPTYQFLDHGKICEACLPRKFHQATVRRCNRGSLSGSLLSTVEATLHRTLKAYGPVDVFICPSEFLRRKMIEGGIPSAKLRHVPHFCAIDDIEPAEHPGTGVFFAGRLSHEKGVDVLLDAVALLPPTVRVSIAGDGPDRAELEERAASNGLSDRVTFLGRVPGSEVHERMRRASVVVMPSRWYENQPMTVLEAAACARAVVATNLGGFPELVEDGVTGRLIAHDDPQALAAALLPYLEDPVTAHEHGRRARSVARERFAPSTHLSALEAVYAEAARSKTRAPLHPSPALESDR